MSRCENISRGGTDGIFAFFSDNDTILVTILMVSQILKQVLSFQPGQTVFHYLSTGICSKSRITWTEQANDSSPWRGLRVVSTHAFLYHPEQTQPLSCRYEYFPLFSRRITCFSTVSTFPRRFGLQHCPSQSAPGKDARTTSTCGTYELIQEQGTRFTLNIAVRTGRSHHG
jgi:hypothetical protein